MLGSVRRALPPSASPRSLGTPCIHPVVYAQVNPAVALSSDDHSLLVLVAHIRLLRIGPSSDTTTCLTGGRVMLRSRAMINNRY